MDCVMTESEIDASSQVEAYQLRDFLAAPARGVNRMALWKQTMGHLVLTMPLRGPCWHDVCEDEFEVRICCDGLHLTSTQRPQDTCKILQDSMSGSFAGKVLVQHSWWSLQSVDGESYLAVHVEKTKDCSWPECFCSQEAKSDSEKEWQRLPPTRRNGVGCRLDSRLSAVPDGLVDDLLTAQTEILITFRVIFNDAAVQKLSNEMPVSRFLCLNLTSDSICLFVRCVEFRPLLAGKLGGNIEVTTSDWSMMKLSHESEEGLRTTRLAVSVQLRKAKHSANIWEPLIVHDPASVCSSFGSQDGIGGRGVETQRADQCELVQLINDDAISRATTCADDTFNLKHVGDVHFQQREWQLAIDAYTKLLSCKPTDGHKVLSNRSAAYVELSNYQAALADASKVEDLAPDWPKAFFRQGIALRGLRRFDMAISAFSEGLALDPQNENLRQQLKQTEEARSASTARRQQKTGSSGLM